MLLQRGVRSGFRAIHNGKGRPALPLPVSRQYSQLLSRGKLHALPSPTSRTRPLQALLVSTSLQSHRHASSTPASSTPSVAASGPATTTPGATSSQEWEALIRDVADTHALQVEPHLGWLKELGLDYGWGPTAVMETVLETVQLASGLPWWASILATTFLVRTLLIRAFVTAADHSARLATVGPLLKPVQAKMRAAQQAGDSEGIAAATQELKATYSAAGIQMRKVFTPILIQGVLGYGMFRLVGGISRLPVPGMESGGTLWFPDLTVGDPFYILPVASGVIMWYALKRGGEMGQVNMDPATWAWLARILPGVTTLVFLNFPAGLQFLACITAAWSTVQGGIMRSPGFRRWCGIAPLPPPRFKTGDQRYTGTVTAYRAPDEVAQAHTLATRFRRARSSMSSYVKENAPTKTPTRLSARERDKAQQYEKERRAEIDAARERFLKEQQQGRKKK